ncbi:MAG: ATP-binding protein, partial [Anaerolineae bacterium]|nr:ATP-binding protein [Anaerolineae bacterium]
MRPYQIEGWVLDIVDRVKTGQPIEDSRVELKATWIEPDRAARRIAGHANAARGAPILWVIGVDEDSGIVGASQEELANWYPQVKAQFDGIAPTLSHYNIPAEGRTVVALYFETDRAPYVVKNLAYGQKGGGPVSLEVPWREGTSTRSATRADLLRILIPLQPLPSFEILGGSLTAEELERQERPALRWSLEFDLYVTTLGKEATVIPFHKCAGSFHVSGVLDPVAFHAITFNTPLRANGEPTIRATPSEVVILGPGRLYIAGSCETA